MTQRWTKLNLADAEKPLHYVMVSRCDEETGRFARLPIVATLKTVWLTPDGREFPTSDNDVWVELPTPPDNPEG